MTMQAYRFNTRISDKGTISLPGEAMLFDREVEVIVIPQPEGRAAPEGYMTLEEFRTTSKAGLAKLLHEHGIY